MCLCVREEKIAISYIEIDEKNRKIMLGLVVAGNDANNEHE